MPGRGNNQMLDNLGRFGKRGEKHQQALRVTLVHQGTRISWGLKRL